MSIATALTESPQYGGHPLITPEGHEIRVPLSVFPLLRQLGVLKGNTARLSSAIYGLLDPNYDSITNGLRHLLGGNLTGPEWCACRCPECTGKSGAEADLDSTPIPGSDAMVTGTDDVSRIVAEVVARRQGVGSRVLPGDRRRRVY